MDPTANLKEQLELAARIIKDFDSADEGKATVHDVASVQAVRLAELVQALDEWINRGGFLPTPWREW